VTLLQVIVLAIIQGLTEFLPVSSSAHLILIGRLFEWPDQGLVLDVAVHLGTLLAVLLYFRHELWSLAGAWFGPADEASARERSLGVTLALASLPVLLVGWLAYDFVAFWLRDVRVIAGATLVFGVLLWAADRFGGRARGMRDMGMGSGLLVGIAQVLALVPGVSRSGITITMGRALGFNADAAARFSFLLSIPAIGAAGVHGAWRLASGGTGVAWGEFLTAMGFAAVAGWLCIAAFLALLQRVGLLPFIVYRLALGVVLLWFINGAPT
jgi:undecaprenyl-diphosphatase